MQTAEFHFVLCHASMFGTESKMFEESRLSGVLYINNSVLYINKLSVLVFSVLSVVKLSLVLHW